MFCYYLADGLWVLGGAVSNAGVVAQWAAESFGECRSQLLAEAERVEPGAEGLIALPTCSANAPRGGTPTPAARWSGCAGGTAEPP